jgi:methyl-accepting chemotaxis protein
VERFLGGVRSDGAPVAMMHWDDAMSTGIATIDRHHKETFDHANALFDRMMAGEGGDLVRERFFRLADELRAHLAEEEREMEAAHFPGLAGHRKDHQAFAERLAALEQQARAGSAEAPQAALAFLSDWLTGHVMKYDKAFAKFWREDRRAA